MLLVPDLRKGLQGEMSDITAPCKRSSMPCRTPSRTEDDEVHSGPWIEALRREFFLIIADYPRGIGRTPAPQGLAFNPDVATEEYLRIADAAHVDRFGWFGYSLTVDLSAVPKDFGAVMKRTIAIAPASAVNKAVRGRNFL